MNTGIGTARSWIRMGLLPLLFPLLFQPGELAAQSVHQDISAHIDPDRRLLIAENTLTLPTAVTADTGATLIFHLHRALEPRSLTAGVELSALETRNSTKEPASYRLHLPAGARSVRLRYEGAIRHPTEAARAAPESVRGTIAPEGVFLGGASYWHPVFDDAMTTFDLLLHLPAGWDAVSQGERVLHQRDGSGTRVQWRELAPQTAIELAAGRYHEYSRELVIDDRRIEAMAFLRVPDEALASRYLDATDTWLRLYQRLFGRYPYGKFALVENFLETGYGMPSFTLLGATVVRLPFIVHTSYPHEILHNWWGNGVYVDAARGNWSEGLTAYFADHLVEERRGEGAAMRRRQLQRYADYVHEGADFPLAAFRSRHDEASQAVGYGKATMFFHMLRRELGEDVLLAGLRDFYRERRFRVSDWDDLRRALEPHAGRDLRAQFSQWIDRVGAPRLVPGPARARALDDGGYELVAEISQTGGGAPYRFALPLRIEMEDGSSIDTALTVNAARATLRMAVPARPLRLAVDPGFDVFRHLERGEAPASFGEVFGAQSVTAILPAGAPDDLRAGYRELAQAWRGARDAAHFRIVDDRDLAGLPEDGAVWLLGWDNALLPRLRAALTDGAVFDGEAVRLPASGDSPPLRLGRNEHAVALAVRGGNEQPLAWLAADHPPTLPALARKLPRYGASGYAAFETGPAAAPVSNGEWPAGTSPLTISIPLEPMPAPAVEPGDEAAGPAD